MYRKQFCIHKDETKADKKLDVAQKSIQNKNVHSFDLKLWDLQQFCPSSPITIIQFK